MSKKVVYIVVKEYGLLPDAVRAFEKKKDAVAYLFKEAQAIFAPLVVEENAAIYGLRAIEKGNLGVVIESVAALADRTEISMYYAESPLE